MQRPENIAELEDSLLNLHSSVGRLIKVIQENADSLDRAEEIMNKLPLLDFYNDDLLRNINTLKKKKT